MNGTLSNGLPWLATSGKRIIDIATGAPVILRGVNRSGLEAAQPQAGAVVDTLKQKGFPALLAIGPNSTLFRVMVGPYPDGAALGKVKADLENAGFHPLVRK